MNSTATLPATQIAAWTTVSELFQIKTEADYDRMIDLIDELVDTVGEDEHNPLSGLIDALTNQALAYEEMHHGIPEASPIEVIRYLMEEHSLTQKDLPEIGSQGVVSEILRGVRQLNTRQITKLASRFGVSPAVFIDAKSAS